MNQGVIQEFEVEREIKENCAGQLLFQHPVSM